MLIGNGDPSTKALRPTVIAGLVALASLPASVSLSLPANRVGSRVLLNIFALVLLSAACMLVVAGHAGRWFGLRRLELAPWWIAYFAFSFGITSVGWASPSGNNNVSQLIRPESIPWALTAAAAAIAALTIGFVSGPLPLLFRILRAAVRWSTPAGTWSFRSIHIPLIIYTVGFLSRAFRIAGGRYGYIGNAAQSLSSPSSLNQVLSQVEQFTRYGLVLAAFNAFMLTRSGRSRRLLIVLCIIEFGFGVASGVKSELVMTALALGIPYSVASGDVPRRAVIVLVLGMLFLVPLNLAYREQIIIASSNGQSAVGQVRRLPEIAVRAYSGKSAGGTLATSTAHASSRLREIDNLALIMQRSPSEIPFRSARELIQGPVTGLIPRALWPTKPILSLGYQFSQQYYNLPAGLYTASAVTIPGDLYRHGGWLILLFGMMILGKIVRAVGDTCSPAGDARRLIFYVSMFLLLINLEGDIVTLLVSLIETVVIAMVVTRFSFVSNC